MKKLFPIFLTITLFSCTGKKDNGYLTAERASWYFDQVEEFCSADGGKLWGEDLYGPLMYIDRLTRKIFANEPDSEGLLKLKDGIYTGFYPRELIIENSGGEFGGTLFGMVGLPPREDTAMIINFSIRGLFHAFQKKAGIPAPRYNTRQMDERNARFWLKLEWKALRKSLLDRGERGRQALRDALIFRGARREQYPGEITDENLFESYQGLATLTHTLLTTKSMEEAEKNLVQTLDNFYRFQSYSRSYGFIHGALYGFLAYRQGFDFRTIRTDSIDLAVLVQNLYDIQLPEICRDIAGSLAVGYEIDEINREEEQRLTEMKERLHRRIADFTEKPVVYIELESPYFDFEPQNIRSLDTLGTIYNSIRVSDNWGKLTVEKGGCLVSYNLQSIRITARNLKESKNHIYGDGWHLILNNEWKIVKADEHYYIRKLIP